MSTHPPFDGDEPDHDDVLSLLFNLVYCSRVADGVDASEVGRIIATSRRNNPARGITGLLVFGSGIFFQWLEGPRESVLELMMARIEKDPRHRAVVVLDSDEEVRERVFGEWDMELVSGEDLRNVLVDALDNAKQPAAPRPCARCWPCWTGASSAISVCHGRLDEAG